MLKKIFNLLPEETKEKIRLLRYFIFSILYYGHARRCPVCERNSRKFIKYDLTSREDAQCPCCGALERHRFVWLYFNRKTNLFDGNSKIILHVSPERCLEPYLRKHFGLNYITADLLDSHADVKMDITNIQYPDEYFDVIYCSHVLEHVQDDKKAMREFYRILKQDGWAILLVPINRDKTLEDPSIVDPSERLRVFGQSDHVREYGADYVDRLREVGFKVMVSTVSELFEKNDIVLMGLTPASGEIYYCTKT